MIAFHILSKLTGAIHQESSVFRKCYGQLGELRSILKTSTSVVALTATATTSVRRTIVESLGMRNYGLIEESPERSNIKYVVFKAAEKTLKASSNGLPRRLRRRVV